MLAVTQTSNKSSRNTSNHKS